MPETITVLIECRACSASGVYEGFAEPKGTGTPCTDCGGKGAKEITGVKFTKRRKKKNLRAIRFHPWMARPPADKEQPYLEWWTQTGGEHPPGVPEI